MLLAALGRASRSPIPRRLLSTTSPWSTLGVSSSGASEEVIRAAFKTKALKIHPDTSDKDPDEAAQEFKMLFQAREDALQSLSSPASAARHQAKDTHGQPVGDRGPPERDQAANFAQMMSRRHEIFAGIQQAHQADTETLKQKIRQWAEHSARKPVTEERRYAGYHELHTLSVRCTEETGGVEIETWDLEVQTPDGKRERLVRERWFAFSVKAWRHRIMQDTLSANSRVTRALYGGQTLSDSDRRIAQELFGKPEVLREEMSWALSMSAKPVW